ncbi:23S rRNA (pseudouridine(1915)-N(3))-methyltransferase RlmH [Olivibacter sp. XZL3]|uniref:23S rRNA (pseudouridine(1915)-N(3))-methyltransferase RlmH n=1 Tax=Olivibacter sp. XZL3 TaxID=1735116 RepID=UPI001066D0F4|nr:23S rRNA (pseudouridine(1915)-N(3))-methyltransferase RlmH [Olivibacter sp. XZL3]
MKITLLCIGKTDESYLNIGIEKYQQRLKHYINFTLNIIPDIKNTKHLSTDQQKAKEAELILKQLNPTDTIVLLDEKGMAPRSIDFAKVLERHMLSGTQHLVFIIGGPYGFDNSLYARAQKNKLSLSNMTFSHQMIRLFFVEQLYRAFSILKGEPYHHE